MRSSSNYFISILIIINITRSQNRRRCLRLSSRTVLSISNSNNICFNNNNNNITKSRLCQQISSLLFVIQTDLRPPNTVSNNDYYYNNNSSSSNCNTILPTNRLAQVATSTAFTIPSRPPSLSYGKPRLNRQNRLSFPPQQQQQQPSFLPVTPPRR